MNDENLLKGIARLKRRRDFLLNENEELKNRIKFLEFKLQRTRTMLKWELNDKIGEE
jgi:hypothetical protein